MKMASRSDLDVIVIMILYEVRASKKRREWLDAICRLIIWTTLSSETSIPRANLTSTSPEQYNRCCVLYSNEDPPSPIWLLTTTAETFVRREHATWPDENTCEAATVALSASVTFQDDGREPRNVTNGSTMGRFFPQTHSTCFAILEHHDTTRRGQYGRKSTTKFKILVELRKSFKPQPWSKKVLVGLLHSTLILIWISQRSTPL